MCFGSFLLVSRVSLFVHDVFLAQIISTARKQVRHLAAGHYFDVFCLSQLILQSEEKIRLSIILPHSPLLSLCNWRAFLHCLRNDSLLFSQSPTKDHTTLLRPLPATSTPLALSRFTHIHEKVISNPDSSATVLVYKQTPPRQVPHITSANLKISLSTLNSTQQTSLTSSFYVSVPALDTSCACFSWHVYSLQADGWKLPNRGSPALGYCVS